MSRFSFSRCTKGTILCGMSALLWPVGAVLKADFTGSTHLVPLDEGGFAYSNEVARGPIEKLQERIDNGSTRLKYDAKSGYLSALLEQLQILKSSQTLVFSRTSLQRDRISPKTPRALYFNDDVYLGFIPDAPVMEISVADPKLGAVFYTLDQSQQEKPRLVRSNQCLECHISSKSMGVPGHILRSFRTDANGVVDFNSGSELINHRTPLSQRWGGWYVTGSHGQQAHLGNLSSVKALTLHKTKPFSNGNMTNLTSRFDTSRYLSPNSDIVALLVLEHQTHGHNFLTRLNYEATTKIARYGEAKYLDDPTEAFLKYLLFTEEAHFTSAIVGSSRFAREFGAQGPKDKRGRSLRDLDLQTRLFKYPCSFLIYSAAFTNLLPAFKDKVYRRLWEILSGEDKSPEYAILSAQDRRAILEILIDTKSDLPGYWRVPNG